jgi:hypothetical protein
MERWAAGALEEMVADRFAPRKYQAPAGGHPSRRAGSRDQASSCAGSTCESYRHYNNQTFSRTSHTKQRGVSERCLAEIFQ